MLTLSAAWLVPAGSTFSKGGRTRLLPAGGMWDAVRTSESLGMPVLERLLADPDDAALLGPVLWDGCRQLLYWLVSPGSSDSYPETARLLGAGSWIAAPLTAGDSTADACWVHLPDHPIVTGPAWLASALGDQGALFGAAA